MSDLRLTDLTQATGITINDLLHIVITGDTSQDPAGSSYKASVEQLYDGLSGYCVPDLYVSNLHSCSPLNINPLDEGGVYFGSTSGITLDVTNKRIGINTSTPQYALDIKGSQSNLYYDPTSVGGNFVISGSTGIPRMGMTIPAYLTKPTAGFNLGMRAWDDVTFTGYGKVGDAFFYAGNQTNGFNILNPVGTGTEDYIRFYAGQTANGTTPDMHIQGSGTTRGYVGIGTITPSEKLHISGNTLVNGGLTATTLNMLSTPTTDTGTTANYLTRDGSTGEIKVKTIPGPTAYGLFAQTGTSVAVSATTVETTLISGGVGSIIIPANGFSVGDSFHGVLIGHLSCVGSATLHIRIKTDSGVLLAETGVMAMEAATNKHWKLDISFTVRQVGAATVASIASGGLFSYTKNSGLNFEGVNFSLVENTTFNTTISNTLVVTAEWNTNNAGNSIYSEIFTLNKIY
jgi:hypothetical protein